MEKADKIDLLKLYPQFTQTVDRNITPQNIPASFACQPDKFEKSASGQTPVVNSNDTFEKTPHTMNDLTCIQNPFADINKVRAVFKDFINTTNTLQSRVNAIDTKLEKHENTTGLIKKILTCLAWIIPIRRVNSVPDKIENKDYLATAGAIAVAGVMLPEDLRDMKDAYNQIFHGKRPIYDYDNCQAPFRFIRGTLVEPIVNKMKKYGYYLHEFDKSFAETKLGEKIRKLLKVSLGKFEETGREVPIVIKDGENYLSTMEKVYAQKLKGSFISKLIYRAMQRTTVIGAVLLFVIGIPSIVKAFKKPKNTQDKIKNASKQTLKVSISVASVLSGIGIVGALGASRFKYVGSVVGMGIGSVIGSLFANKVNKNIKT